MKIFFDENMPFAREFFSDFGELTAFAGRTLTTEQVAEADVLLVRSITEVNQSLLAANNKLQFVGTATIGVDHIDQHYLRQRGINFSAAPGCNAISVAEYVLSSLVVLAERYQLVLQDLTVGIIGAGNTGSRLSEKLDAIGVNYLLCDPLLAQNDNDQREFVALEQALACDVISLHVPKTTSGDYPTYHLLNEQRLSQLSSKQILINACRGEVTDNQALLKMKQRGHGVKLVLDVWENEPQILTELISYCEITTAHIAGYSLEGKARGTEMLYQALSRLLNKPVEKSLTDFLPDSGISHIEINQGFDEILLNQLVKMVYDVRRDDALFRQQIGHQQETALAFDLLRKTYPARREFSSVNVSSNQQHQSAFAHRLGFGNLR
ncbi:erythronate-4-phosphate dehydrogenase [Thalassotalea insulae]|uniref:Erythronate-4-phosphate dehydrogenase n=1 Tax=Thalassotalea insulae TaxID=2056778 RepID=A0ABQ6GPC3_9GAMM|nr:4-phosphoerythronate dehydrogenase [Thalassotalea insulae]GLX77444.1 erythronate-4-phosphate dehydrogenase [Thalassotalea insulae]